MTRWFSFVLAVALASGVLAGCGGKQPAAPAADPAAGPGEKPATPDDLVKVWDQLVAAPQDQLNFELAHAVAQDLANRGPEGVVPLIKKIDVAEPTPQAIVLTLAALRDVVKPENEALLTELSGPTHGSYTRRVVIDLLGGIKSDTVVKTMEQLEQDPDLLISVAAYLARLHQGDDAYVARMKTYWDNPKVHDASRQEMMRRLPEASAPAAIEQLCDAAKHVNWDIDVRRRVVGTLGFLTDKRALEALKFAAENSPEPEMHEFAQKAVDAMQVRVDSGGTFQQVEVGPDGIHKAVMPLSAQPGDPTPNAAGTAPVENAAPAPAAAQ